MLSQLGRVNAQQNTVRTIPNNDAPQHQPWLAAMTQQERADFDLMMQLSARFKKKFDGHDHDAGATRTSGRSAAGPHVRQDQCAIA